MWGIRWDVRFLCFMLFFHIEVGRRLIGMHRTEVPLWSKKRDEKKKREKKRKKKREWKRKKYCER